MRRIAILCCVLIAALGAEVATAVAFQSPPQKATLPSVSAAPSEVVPPPHGYRFPNGQTFTFQVEWHLFTAGTTRLKLDTAGVLEQVTATADSSGVANVLYGVHDRFQSSFDPAIFCSLRISKHTEEGFHKRDTEIVFDYSRHKTVLDETNLKTNEKKHEENDLASCVTDVVTGFFYLGSLPLQPGSSYTFPMSDGGKTADVKATVEGREHIKVPAGSFETVRVQAEAISGTLKGKGKIWVWYTDDPNHTPVQMRSKLGWGTLLFRLQRLEK
jgi:hypothetical protein